jgi:hypothetical protein
MMRTRIAIIALFFCGWLAGTALADTFKLTDGRTVTGELLNSAATEAGVKVKTGEGEYQTIPWANFSQEDLKKFATDKKMGPLVEPFIEISQEEKAKKTEVPNIKHAETLKRPDSHSVLGALGSTGLGVFILLLLYAGNLYAAYEISIFRAQPTALVCGVAAVAPIIGPIVFLSMPTKVQPTAPTWETASEAATPTAAAVPAGAPTAAASDPANPMQVEGAQHPGALHLAHTETPPQSSALPPTQTFQRGQFTFNRRFFETKFPGFFGVVKRDADKDMVLVFKTARGTFVGQRIARIASNDLHLQVQKGPASEEVMVPFGEIQEIQLKHKAA